eukprot:353631-Chlamydomonas_euryale.AAC.11
MHPSTFDSRHALFCRLPGRPPHAPMVPKMFQSHTVSMMVLSRANCCSMSFDSSGQWPAPPPAADAASPTAADAAPPLGLLGLPALRRRLRGLLPCLRAAGAGAVGHTYDVVSGHIRQVVQKGVELLARDAPVAVRIVPTTRHMRIEASAGSGLHVSGSPWRLRGWALAVHGGPGDSGWPWQPRLALRLRLSLAPLASVSGSGWPWQVRLALEAQVGRDLDDFRATHCHPPVGRLPVPHAFAMPSARREASCPECLCDAIRPSGGFLSRMPLRCHPPVGRLPVPNAFSTPSARREVPIPRELEFRISGA